MGIGPPAAILLTQFGLQFLYDSSGGHAAGLSWGLAWATLRLKGDYYVIASFGFQIILYNIFLNWIGLTRGPFGIRQIPRPEILGFSFLEPLQYALFTLGILALCLWVARRVGESPYGKVLRAIREDEAAAASIGKNVNRYKMSIFTVTAMLASVGNICQPDYLYIYSPSMNRSLFWPWPVSVVGNVWWAGDRSGGFDLLPNAPLFHVLTAAASPSGNTSRALKDHPPRLRPKGAAAGGSRRGGADDRDNHFSGWTACRKLWRSWLFGVTFAPRERSLTSLIGPGQRHPLT
jgi:hypothetical protein